MSDILTISHVNSWYTDNSLGIFTKQKKKHILKDVSLSIRDDEFFGLVGESGCGKSTLANCILGQIPYTGDIKVDGLDHRSADRLQFTSRVQAVLQDPLSSLNPRRTIGAALAEPLIAHHIGTKEEQKQKVDEMLNRVGLDPTYAARYPKELSGGQRQRVCIGAALMLEPPLVIADEPVSALDVSVQAQILNLFRTIDEKRDFSMLFISHNLLVVYYLCDRIAVMYNGTIVEQGSAEAVCTRPAHPYTRLLLSAIPDLGGPMHALPEKKEKGIQWEETKGCVFAARCPYATDQCKIKPSLRNLNKTDAEPHLAACHLAGSEALSEEKKPKENV